MIQRQIILAEQEQERLRDRIYHDFLAARSNHDARIERFRRYYRLWRGLPVESAKAGPDGPDLQVPLLKWVTFGQWAKYMQSLLGDDAEIIASPTAPLDQKIAVKVGHYETWRFFEYMKATNPLAVWVLRAALMGRAHAEMLYDQEYYWERDPETGEDSEVRCYDAPRLIPLWHTQLVTPAQDDVSNVDQFEWIIRRKRVTPQQLLDGERRGRYQGIKSRWNEIFTFAQQRQERDYWWDDEKIDADTAEGVEHSSLMGNRESLEMWEWYGTWRMLKGNRQVKEESIFYRDTKPTELLVRYLPKVSMIVGVQDRRDLYPRMKKRTPFLDIGLVKDGSYWSPGLGEMLEDLQSEATINHALFRRIGMISAGPVILYTPASGFDPDTFQVRGGEAIPTKDPAGVKVVQFPANMEYPTAMGQLVKTIAELVTGFNDQTVGQQIDRPNAPKTLGGQMLLAEGANVRASLDMTMLREDLSQALEYCWALDREYSDDEVFFRVTEEDAGGLYDIQNGFGTMTAEERMHNFDFELKFATSVWSREAKKQSMLALYQLSLQNPIVAQNPRALWVLLNRIWQAFGEQGFKDIVPEPPETDAPQQPKDEWALALKGEEVHVNPLDDDKAHILDHRKRLEHEEAQPKENRDPHAEKAIGKHIVDHERQMRQKMLLQLLVQRAAQEQQQQQGQQPGGPLGAPQPIPQTQPEAPVPVVQPQPQPGAQQ